MQVSFIQVITSRGGTVVEIEDTRVYPGEEEFFLLLYEFERDLKLYLANTSSPYKNLEDLIAFNNANEDSVMPYFKQEIFEASIEASR